MVTATNIERELAAAVRRSKAAHARASQADAERDEMIRKAVRAGLAQTRIADITGLSFQRVHQIHHGTRGPRD